MAVSLRALATTFARSVRCVSTTGVRAMGGASAPIPGDSKDKATGVTGRIPDEDEQSTGIERQELNKMLEGVEDPFGTAMEPKFGPRGTLEAPRMIPSHFDARMVGICDEGSEQIHFFELKASDEPVYVNGEYFKLYKVTEDVHP